MQVIPCFQYFAISLNPEQHGIINISMIKLYFIAIMICFASCKQSQIELNTTKDFNIGLEELVLSSDDIGVEYFVKVNNPKEILEYKMTYIGYIENSRKEKLKFIYSAVFSGLYEDSKRVNSIITIYKDKERLGHYYLGGGFNKTPMILQKEVLIAYNDDNCNQTTRINFRDSIPKEIFIHCKEVNGKMFGDLYSFEKQN